MYKATIIYTVTGASRTAYVATEELAKEFIREYLDFLKPYFPPEHFTSRVEELKAKERTA